MTRLRRSGIVLAGFFTLHLAVPVVGAACAMPSMHMGAAASLNESAAMSGTSVEPLGDPAQNEAPCNTPGVPGNCTSSASCTGSLIGPVSESLTTTHALRAPPATLAVLAPTSRALLPELPPPRA